MSGPQGRYGHLVAGNNVLSMPRIEPTLLGHPDRSLVTLPTTPSPLTNRLYLYATGKKGVVVATGIERGGRNQFRF